MFKINNFIDNDDIMITDEKGAFRVAEYKRDLSVTKETAQKEYFAAQMGVRLKQLVCDLSVNPVIIQQGAMQWMVGDVNAGTGIKGVGDFFSKSLRSSVTNESAIKPEYHGTGMVVLEPTYKYIILLDVKDWNGGMVLEDGYFLACESSLQHKTVARSSI